jgi:hypothetical protein
LYNPRLNFSDTEIEVFCSRYDVDGNFEFSFEEVRAAIEAEEDDEAAKPAEDAEKTEAPPFNLYLFEG